MKIRKHDLSANISPGNAGPTFVPKWDCAAGAGPPPAFTAPQFAAVPSVPSCPANPESGRQLLPRASVVVFAVVEKRFPEPKSLLKEESKDRQRAADPRRPAWRPAGPPPCVTAGGGSRVLESAIPGRKAQPARGPGYDCISRPTLDENVSNHKVHFQPVLFL